jgi:flavin-binding protein dodecin
LEILLRNFTGNKYKRNVYRPVEYLFVSKKNWNQGRENEALNRAKDSIDSLEAWFNENRMGLDEKIKSICEKLI